MSCFPRPEVAALLDLAEAGEEERAALKGLAPQHVAK